MLAYYLLFACWLLGTLCWFIQMHKEKERAARGEMKVWGLWIESELWFALGWLWLVGLVFLAWLWGG